MTDNPQPETTLVEGPQTVTHNANRPAAWQQADLEAENAKLIRWHREDGDALAEMRGTIARLRAELGQQAEDPARIDRLRPEFTEHSSVESIDVQLRRARSQLRRWHLRVEWLISLRQARLEQKARGEWPAAVSQPGKEA